MWLAHVFALLLYFVWWACYEIAFLFWSRDQNSKTDTADTRLRILAFTELCFNLSSVFLGLVLFRLMDKMTRKV